MMSDKFEAVPIRVPTLVDISTIYNEALVAQDATLKTIAEQAVSRLAAAEAASAEAATFVAFHSLTKK
jgi:hypothetical protein